GGMGGNDFAVVIDTEEQAGRFNVAVTVGKALVSSAFVPANDPTKWVIDTVNAVKRGVARHGKSTFSIGEDRFFERAADPADEAATLIKQGAEGALNKMFQSRLDDILKAFKDAQKQMDGLRRVGAGNTEAGTLLTPIVRKLRELEQFAGKAADHAVKVGELREEEEDDEEDDDEEDDEDEDGDTCEACGCGGKKKRKRGMAEGATEGARSKGTGYGRGETAAAGEFWSQGPTGKKDDKKKFNKAQRSGKKAHIDAQMRGEGLSGELEALLSEGKKPWWDPEKYKQFSSESQQEIAAVKDLINMMIQDAPDGHVVDLADFAKTMGGPAGKAVKKYLPSLMGVGGAWTGNATLVWPKDEKGNYDKSKFVVMRKGGKK
ncbi:MAG: hypothetical protein LC118_20675, partial [Dehalococcoidia bacterium]|nr:hypothetical protein [Dehalococcoidia bacterium]